MSEEPRRVPDRRNHLDPIAIALIVVCCVLWGLQQVVVKATLPSLPPLMQAGARSTIAALMLWVWAAAKGIPLFERDGTFVAGVTAGVLFAAEFTCIYAALPLTNASRVVVFIYIAPFVVALGLPRFVPSEKLTAPQIFGLVCAFAALAYAFQEALTLPTRRQLIGDTLAVAAAVLWGATTLVVRATKLSFASPEKTLFYQLAVSAPLLFGAAFAAGEAWPATALSASTWASLGFQSAVVAFASYLAWFWLLRHYPATRVSAFSFLTPMFGLVFGALVLGEAISMRLLVALAFIALGIWLVNRKTRIAV